ncbi:MAG: hypothetical protein GKR89_06780 [Candidatus Latescibacteria bacterium]|nr:hypothetical protein [Candidatus Latescibacterota bacterium]
MNAKPIDGQPKPNKTDWARFHALTDAEIEAAAQADPDASLTDEAFWADARVVVPLSLDRHTFKWYQGQDKPVEALMHAALKHYMESHTAEE